MTNYKSAPIPATGMPGGVPYIIGNEAAERFSFYGMKTILVIFMTKYLMDQSGALDVMNREEALTWYHLFSSGVYFTQILGAQNNEIRDHELFFSVNYFREPGNSKRKHFYSKSGWKS